MKNIHILPTDKPSRLGRFIDTNNLFLRTTDDIPRGENINIYITSDEEIKEGDWFIFGVNESVLRMLEAACKANIKYNGAKKIMLTTDPQLIKFGVQAIDDDFLEWFVKNPSCEKVVVIYEPKNFFDVKKGWEYKIIIPKEQQKQHIIDIMKSDEELGLYEQTKCYCGHTITCDCGPEQEIKLEEVFNDDKKENIKKFIDEINNPSEPNQALKDAAERLKGKELFKESNDRARKTLSEIKSLPIQERSYSEENMIAFGEFIFKHTLLAHSKGVKNLFEQFKKN
jgi:hypothetical protein